MGAWGPALFSDVVACDVRDEYREHLEESVDDDVALSRTLARFARMVADPQDGPVVILALAVTASKLGRLTPELRDRAIALLDTGRGLERWEDDPKSLVRLAIEVGDREFMAIRVVRIDDTKSWVAPTVQILDWRGDRLPIIDDVRAAPDMETRPAPSPWFRTRGTYLAGRGDFPDHGFVRIGTIAPRAGDAEALAGGVGGWKLLVSQMRAIVAAG